MSVSPSLTLQEGFGTDEIKGNMPEGLGRGNILWGVGWVKLG